MRILIVNNYAHVTGGADIYSLEITEGLRQRGHEVKWLATESPENVETSGAFIPLAVSSSTRTEISNRGKLDAARKALWNPTAASAADRLIGEFQPDVVHVHKAYVQLSVAPIVVAARQRVPLVQTVHDYEFVSASPFDSEGQRWDHDESHLAYQAVNSATFPIRRLVHRPRIDSWIAVSETVARIYKDVGGIDCEVIPNFSDSSARTPVPQESRSGALFLGRLSEQKGIRHLIEAARMSPDTQFRVAGDGPLKSEVEDASNQLENLDYLGFISKEEGGRLLSESLVCLMPSVWEEPAGLACLEAMAEGTPVICFPRGGLAEYVNQSGAGVICSTIGPRQLSESISELTSNHKKWAESSAAGRSAIAGIYSRATHLDSLVSVYEKTASTADRVS